MTSSPCPIFGGPHPPKIYEYKPPTFGPKGNQDQKHQQPPPPADAHGIRTNLQPREAIADSMKMAFVNGAAWCLKALIRQINHELKTKNTMFGFKPDKKVRKQEIVNKTVTDYFQSNNPPTLAALSGAEDVGSKFGRYYPDLFLPIPGSKQEQEQQRQQQANMNSQNSSSAPESVTVYMGEGPVPAAFMATVPDSALASVMRKSDAAASRMQIQTQAQNQANAPVKPATQTKTSSPPSQTARTTPPTTKASTNPATGPKDGTGKQQMRIGKWSKGKKKKEEYYLTGAFHEVSHGGEISYTWECVDGQYRMLDEVYPDLESARAEGKKEISQAQRLAQPTRAEVVQPVQAPPVQQQQQQQKANAQSYTHMQAGQGNGNAQYTQQQHQQHQQAVTQMQGQGQGNYIIAASTGNGPLYTFNGGNNSNMGGSIYSPPQMQQMQHPQQQQQHLYTVSPQLSTPATVKRKRAPDTESAIPLTKRRGGQAADGGSCNPAELMLSQSRG